MEIHRLSPESPAQKSAVHLPFRRTCVGLLSKLLCVAVFTFLLCGRLLAQCDGQQDFLRRFKSIEADTLPGVQKLRELYKIKKDWDQCHLSEDSVYAGILRKIGVYEFETNKNYQSAITHTLRAARINLSGKQAGSIGLAVKCYFNLAYYYQDLTLFPLALVYYDTTILLAQSIPDPGYFILDSRLNKSNIYFQIGDYQKGVDESSIGINYALKKEDSVTYLAFLNQRAQSLFYQGQINQSFSDVETIIKLSTKMKDMFQLASGLKIKGLIYARKRQFEAAESVLKQSIDTRSRTGDYSQLAGDYNDFGNFYMDSLDNYSAAKNCYFRALEYALKNNDSVRIARINSNIGLSNYFQGFLLKAGSYYLRALSYLKANNGSDLLINTSATHLNLVSQKELILEIMTNKTGLLLQLFKTEKNRKYLLACLQTAILTDSLVTQMRHEQLAEGSKLYWRNRTREFFTNSLEACYMAGDMNLAFFFMERSRAVLLNDQLKELGAFAFLPPAEAVTEQSLHLAIIREQQRLNLLKDASAEFMNQEAKLFQAKDQFERYIKHIEKKYPNYYQYKYQDETPALKDLNKYLAANHQSFVYYFMNDTVTYVLSMGTAGSTFLRLSRQELQGDLPAKFLDLCSNATKLNNNYQSFISISNTLYKRLFEPLKIPRGRVIICPDNFLLPFEAMCMDKLKKNFLVGDYSFSYVYSARYLLKKYNDFHAKGSFIGFAPVEFPWSVNTPPLEQSAAALQEIGAYYKSPRLFTHAQASRRNFINAISKYRIVNIFSHAGVVKTASEPVLFMADSTVPLSELQTLRNPAIELVVLSACETNVGKNATGEGIYSLARGFAAAGVPTIAATLWNAEESATYFITNKFHENLSKGMNKDEALQHAKLAFRASSDNENVLPYYWANMILMGNAEPVQLNDAGFSSGGMILISAVVLVGGFLLYRFYRRRNLLVSNSGSNDLSARAK